MTRKDPTQLALPGVGRGGVVARMRRAVDAQLAAQRKLGHLEPIDAGVEALVRSFADSLDREALKTDRSEYTLQLGLTRLEPILLRLRGERTGDAGAGVDVELLAAAAAFLNAERSATVDPRPTDPGAHAPTATP